MHKITYKPVVQGTSEFEKMQSFAASFEHSIVASPDVALHALMHEQRLFGYAETVFLPVAYPAFHPEFTKPRDVVQVMSDWRAHVQLLGKPAYLGVPLENDRPNFRNPVMQKLGLYQLKRELFTPV